MAIDWDAELLGPVMSVFGEGQEADPSSWPTYRTSRGVPAIPIPCAVYDAQYQRVSDLGDGSPVTSTHPVLGVRDTVFADIGITVAQGGIIYVPSVDKVFSVRDVQPDGHGHTLLILIEAA